MTSNITGSGPLQPELISSFFESETFKTFPGGNNTHQTKGSLLHRTTPARTDPSILNKNITTQSRNGNSTSVLGKIAKFLEDNPKAMRRV